MHERSLREQASELAENEGEKEEEARTAKPSRDPRDPTAADRAMHEAIHVPFRSCAVCVGRRENPPHRTISPQRERSARNPGGLLLCPTGRRDRNCDASGRGGPLLRAIQAWVVERKVSDLDAADVIQRALKGLRSFGHRGRVAIKAENEPAILALKEEIMRRPEVGAIPVESVTMIHKTTAPMK